MLAVLDRYGLVEYRGACVVVLREPLYRRANVLTNCVPTTATSC